MAESPRNQFLRIPSIINHITITDFDEEKVIEEALTTPFEKVMKILIILKKHLEDTKSPQNLISDLEFVIQRILSHKLYTYEMTDNTIQEFEKLGKYSNEVKSFFDHLQNYSENKEIKRRNKDPKICKTTEIKNKVLEIREKRNTLKFGTNTSNIHLGLPGIIIKSPREVEKNNSYTSSGFKLISSQNSIHNIHKLKFDHDESDSSPVAYRLRVVGTAGNNILPTKEVGDESSETNSPKVNINDRTNIQINDEYSSTEETPNFSHKIEINPFTSLAGKTFKEYMKMGTIINELPQSNIEIIGSAPESEYDIENVLDMDFNIFEFTNLMGRKNALPVASKTIIESYQLNNFFNNVNLDMFLQKVGEGYKRDIPYHNDLHGLDVCQTAFVYISHTNISDILFLNDLDILSIFLSTLMHDLGHPGTNNAFQVNSISRMALTYNDKSVLENFHSSEAFSIINETNILKLSHSSDFRHLRKRMIESILSTDMIFHAKIQSLVKNKMQLNGIKEGVNQNLIINKNSNSNFDDQQEIINFLIHTADISHNSKDFKISYKWTYYLMDEFWLQGDLERDMHLPISFLCDRKTADVPKSQIGFIKGIIIPSFDILVDLLPALNWYRENVFTNVEEWTKIVREEEEKNKIILMN
jgi:hypothetical protein